MKAKNKTYLIIAVATLIVFAIGGTYAFFSVIGGNTTTRNVKVETYAADALSFSITSDISISADQGNFGPTAGDKVGETAGKAILIPNTRTNSATDTYYVYLVIDSNNFQYTTNNKTAELVLEVTGPEGSITNITGLNGENGVFDITTRTGAFLVAEQVITANTHAGTTDNWTATVTLRNLDSDQQENTNKNFHATLYMTKQSRETYTLAEINTINTSHTNEITNEEESNITYNSITVDLGITAGTENISKYYYGIEEVNEQTGYIPQENKIINGITYFESNEPTYTFPNLKENTNYKVYALVEDSEGFMSNRYETTVKTNEYVLPQVSGATSNVTYNSFKITATGTNGDGTITNYQYDCGDGLGWSNTEASNEYTCSNLESNTTYNYKIKAIDSNNRESVMYTSSVTTSELTASLIEYTNSNTTRTNVKDALDELYNIFD